MHRKYLFLPARLLLFGALLCFSGTAHAATLSFSNASGTVGQTVSVSVLVSAQGEESLNGVSARIRYPTDKLSLVSLSKSGSIITFWAEEPSFSNSSGTASVEGIVPNPGYSGTGGRVITLVFQVKAPGSATLSFANATVLANDGRGTNVLTNTYPRTLTLAAPVPSPTPSQPPVSGLKPAPKPSGREQEPKPPAPDPTTRLESASSSAATTTEANSVPTPRTAIIENPESGYPWVGKYVVWALMTLGIIALIMLGFLGRIHSLRKKKHTQMLIHRSFGLLKKDLVAHIEKVKNTNTTLSHKEVAFLEQFKEDLNEFERFIETGRNPLD